MKKVILAAMVLMLAGCEQTHSGATRFSLMTDPATFAAQTASDRALEEAMAQLAMRRAKSDDVKSYAQRIVVDNLQNDKLLQAVAEQNKVGFPAPLSNADLAKIHALTDVAHDQFDRIFMDTMVDSQRNAFRNFTAAAKSADTGISEYAKASLPVIRDHLDNAERVDVLVGGGLGPSSGY